jgi:hypothetical protein
MSYPAPHPLTPQDCLVALMIAISASDTNIRTVELVKIQSAVNNLPVFADYDIDRVNLMSQTVFDLFEQEDAMLRQQMAPCGNPNCGCLRKFAMSWRWTGCMRRLSNAARAPDTSAPKSVSAGTNDSALYIAGFWPAGSKLRRLWAFRAGPKVSLRAGRCQPRK